MIWPETSHEINDEWEKCVIYPIGEILIFLIHRGQNQEREVNRRQKCAEHTTNSSLETEKLYGCMRAAELC